MPSAPIELSLTQARRLAVVSQRLAGLKPRPDLGGLVEIARAIRCIQVDPTNAVARTQLLVLRSRVGTFDATLLDRLQWEDKFLFHYWAHAASMVLTEDFPLFRYHMRRAFDPATGWGRRVRDWIAVNRALRDHILRELRQRGPLRMRDLEDRSVVPWPSTGWTAARNISRMLEFLWAMGRVVVAGRVGQERLWHLMDRWLPEWTPRRSMAPRRVVSRSAEIALRCLGVGTPRHITEHFTRGSYPAFQRLFPISSGEALSGQYGYEVQTATSPAAGTCSAIDSSSSMPSIMKLGALAPHCYRRSTISSDRQRTETIFGFRYRIEIYVPKDRRRFGFYALPILHGDRLIGRLDASVDRTRNVLVVNALHAEPDAPEGPELRRRRGVGRVRAGRVCRRWAPRGTRSAIPRAWRAAFA
ncbi:MAG: DNA glycosylase AlkZ-like family protein [Actinomycetota bacterium]